MSFKYESLEKQFNVIYPSSKSATYISLLNFSVEGNTNRQRWYRYKEGYSFELIVNLINKYNKNRNGVILDPFLGSGTTIFASNSLGLKGIGFEVNPFSYFLAKSKLTNYNKQDINTFSKSFSKILSEAKEVYQNYSYDLPKLSISHKVLHESVRDYFMTVKGLIDDANFPNGVTNLLNLGWLASLETVSQYKKAGNGLKKKVRSKNTVDTIERIDEILINNFEAIKEDLNETSVNFDAELINDTSLHMKKYISDNSISGVIFSPPYANAFDYTEIYKLELWFGKFVEEYSDLKNLRKQSLRSHLNGLSSKINRKELNLTSLPELEYLIEQIEQKKLWDKKIPLMIAMYFNEMFQVLRDVYTVLEDEGFCSIIVGNSSYGGVIVPTDLILSKYAKHIGFNVEEINIDRFIITSSQQYHETVNNKKYLRESVICLTKKKK